MAVHVSCPAPCPSWALAAPFPGVCVRCSLGRRAGLFAAAWFCAGSCPWAQIPTAFIHLSWGWAELGKGRIALPKVPVGRHEAAQQPLSPRHIVGENARAPRGTPLCWPKALPGHGFCLWEGWSRGGDFGTASRSARIRAASCFLPHSAAAPSTGSPWLPVRGLLGTAHPQPQGSRQQGGDGKDLLQARKSLLSPPAGPPWAATMLRFPRAAAKPRRDPGGPGRSRRGEGRRGLRDGDKETGSALVPAARGEPAAGQARSCDVRAAVPAWTAASVSSSSSLRNAAIPLPRGEPGTKLERLWALQHPRAGV